MNDGLRNSGKRLNALCGDNAQQRICPPGHFVAVSELRYILQAYEGFELITLDNERHNV